MLQASYLFLNVLMPIFLQVFAGFLLQKRFPTEIGSLSKVQFYVFIPAIAFTSLYTTTLGGSLLLAIIASCVLVALILFGISWLVVRGARLNMDKRHALYNAVTIYNSGNYCIPLIQLLYNTPFSYSVQIVIVLVQSVLTNTFGIYNTDAKGLNLAKLLRVVLYMPTTLAMLAAVACRLLDISVWQPMMVSLNVLASGLVPLALVTLGAQLATSKIGQFPLDIWVSSILRLFGGPLVAWVIVSLLGIEGVAAQVIIICSGAPSAVNTVVLALEFNGDPDFASKTVLLSTLLSAVTMPLVIGMALLYT